MKQPPCSTGRPWVLAGRIPELDGLRGCAALLILLAHYFGLWAPVAYTPAYYVRRCMALGYCGVDLFFVLSGFLIGGILLDQRRSSRYFPAFYFRRACRIFPLYYANLAVFFAAWFCLSQKPSFAWFFPGGAPRLLPLVSFTSNMFDPGNYSSWLGVLWSLAIEEQFYLAVPLLIFLLDRSRLALMLFVFILFAPLLRAIAPELHSWTPWRSDCLLMGVLLALVMRTPACYRWLQANIRMVQSTWWVLWVGLVVMTVKFQGPGSVISHFYFGVFFSLLVAIVVLDPKSWIACFLRLPVLMYSGRISYGLYLLHAVVLSLVFGIVKGVPPTLQNMFDLGLVCVCIMLTFLACAASFRYFERPFIALGSTARF